jgi:hypothetical protein
MLLEKLNTNQNLKENNKLNIDSIKPEENVKTGYSSLWDYLYSLFNKTALGIQYWHKYKNKKCYICRNYGHRAAECNKICPHCQNLHNGTVCVYSVLTLFTKIENYLIRHTIDDEQATISYIEKTKAKLITMNTDLQIKSLSKNFDNLCIAKEGQYSFQVNQLEIRKQRYLDNIIPLKLEEPIIKFQQTSLNPSAVLNFQCAGNKKHGITYYFMRKPNRNSMITTGKPIKCRLSKASQPAKSTPIITINEGNHLQQKYRVYSKITNIEEVRKIQYNNENLKMQYQNKIQQAEQTIKQQLKEGRGLGVVSISVPEINIMKQGVKSKYAEIIVKLSKIENRDKSKNKSKTRNNKDNLLISKLLKEKASMAHDDEKNYMNIQNENKVVTYQSKNSKILKKLQKYKAHLQKLIKQQELQLSTTRYAVQAMQHHARIEKENKQLDQQVNIKQQKLQQIKNDQNKIIAHYKEKATKAIQGKVNKLKGIKQKLENKTQRVNAMYENLNAREERFNQRKNDFFDYKEEVFDARERQQKATSKRIKAENEFLSLGIPYQDTERFNKEKARIYKKYGVKEQSGNADYSYAPTSQNYKFSDSEGYSDYDSS